MLQLKERLTRKEVQSECVPVQVNVFRGRAVPCYARVRKHVYTPADGSLDLDYDLYDHKGFYSRGLSNLAARENAWEDIDKQIIEYFNSGGDSGKFVPICQETQESGSQLTGVPMKKMSCGERIFVFFIVFLLILYFFSPHLPFLNN